MPPKNGDQHERDRRDQLEVERLGRFLAGVRPRRRQRVNQARAEEPEEEHRKVRDASHSAAGLLTRLGPDQWLVRRVDTERPRRGRNLDKTIEGLVQLLAGDCCEDLPDPPIELRTR